MMLPYSVRRLLTFSTRYTLTGNEACLWWFAGTAIQVATTSGGMLIAGRMLNGVCVGITSSQVPVYLAEIAKKNQRGSILVIQQLAIEVGILLMFFIGMFEPSSSHPCSARADFICRVWLQFHPRPNRIFPHRLGRPIHTLSGPLYRPAVPATLT